MKLFTSLQQDDDFMRMFMCSLLICTEMTFNKLEQTTLPVSNFYAECEAAGIDFKEKKIYKI